MLYPRIYVEKEETIFIEKLKYIKESLLEIIKIFSSYNSFLLFIEQKFHF